MMVVVDVSLTELEQRRAALLEQLAQVGDFRRGSVSESYRRCGKPNCACARPEHPGHGPRLMWTRRGAGGKTVGRGLAPGEVAKVRAEVAAYHRFRELTEQSAEVSEAICEVRPTVELDGDSPPGAADAEADAGDSQAAAGSQKGGFRTGPAPRSKPRSKQGSKQGSRRGSAPKSTG